MRAREKANVDAQHNRAVFYMPGADFVVGWGQKEQHT